MWVLLLGTFIITSLAIWGITVMVDTPTQEQVSAEVSYQDFTSYNQLTNRSQFF